MSPFITLEGGDGAGKTTQVALLVDRLQIVGVDVLHVREPGGTALGEALRPLIKGEIAASPLAELLLLETARAQLVEEVIAPALEAGRTVVSDRFYDSTIAYQGFGRGLDMNIIQDLNRIASSGITPDATILLDIEPTAALSRIGAGIDQRSDPADQQRFESQPLEFHERLIEGYRSLAAEEPARWYVIDASTSVDRVGEKIWAVVTSVLKL
ncbi:MAG: dTMP kinase [Chloroflexi bacterium]|nr:dTMP kinase [Chloroflexota bacterium]